MEERLAKYSSTTIGSPFNETLAWIPTDLPMWPADTPKRPDISWFGPGWPDGATFQVPSHDGPLPSHRTRLVPNRVHTPSVERQRVCVKGSDTPGVVR